MSFRQLIEGDCGRANPLMQFKDQIFKGLRDKDEFNRIPPTSVNTMGYYEDQLVHEFVAQIGMPPQTFKTDALLEELRQIEIQSLVVNNAPRVIDEVTKKSEWTSEYFINNSVNELPAQPAMPVISQYPQQIQVKDIYESSLDELVDPFHEGTAKQFMVPQQSLPLALPGPIISSNQPLNVVNNESNQTELMTTKEIFEEEENKNEPITENWLEDFSKNSAEEVQKTIENNQMFWDKLQDEWNKLSENDIEYPWLSYCYDPYKDYTFAENNPMLNDKNAFEKGKQFLKQGDIPNAVLCFEAAVKQQPESAEAWEYLGKSQAENEMDPSAIAALKKSYSLNPNNRKVLMELVISYTNENIPNLAMQYLLDWLNLHPEYSDLVSGKNILKDSATNTPLATLELKTMQNIFLEAVQRNPNEVDPDIQEGLGVLFTLSSEYDKAADCFRAALQVKPDNANLWNRLGASLANGSRSIEAVEAYKKALEISPGFVRARYNVGIVCLNLKAFKEAAEHLLAALNLQATSSLRSGQQSKCDNGDGNDNPLSKSKQMSDTIWSTLRMVTSLMGRWDLQEAIDSRNLDALNKVFSDNSEQE